MLGKIRNIHFIGIGGSGMSGIAEVLLNLGYKVSGSDIRETDVTKRIEALGGRVYIGHNANNVKSANVVVVSTAVSRNNDEVAAAKKLKIPVIPRAEMLAELMRLKYGIAVAGAHGKTTTTSMTAVILDAGGFDPTIVIGGRLNNIRANAKLGKGDYIVVEADESDGSFLKLSPTIVVVTNIDLEHLDYYGSIKRITDAFFEFMSKVPFYGTCIVCEDDYRIKGLIEGLEKRCITYGLAPSAEIRAENIVSEGMETSYSFFYKKKKLGDITLQVPGIHNVKNSLAAAAVGLELGIDFLQVKDALNRFSGVQRRIEVKGTRGGVMVIDDYAHHPTEIKVTIDTIKKVWKKDITVVFQPHRYSRTHLLYEQFPAAFEYAKRIIVTDIYAAGEEPIPGVNSMLIVNCLRDAYGDRQIEYIPFFEEIINYLKNEVKDNEIVITIGAGDIWKLGETYLKS